MKPPKPYTHILIVPEPLPPDSEHIEMRCGVILAEPLFRFGHGIDLRPDLPYPVSEKLCPVCRAHAFDPPAAKDIPMWEYGLLEKKEWIAYKEARPNLKTGFDDETEAA